MLYTKLLSFLTRTKLVKVTPSPRKDLRTGRWVVWKRKPAIYVEYKPLYLTDPRYPDGHEMAVEEIDAAIIHLVNKDGLTVEEKHVPHDELRIARLKEIPESRVPNPQLAKYMGYK